MRPDLRVLPIAVIPRLLGATESAFGDGITVLQCLFELLVVK